MCYPMDYLLKKFLPRIEFDSYEDFKENYKVNVPEDFNFGFDVVDAWAKEEPEKKALVWCDEQGDELTFTFTDIMRLSNKAANFFRSLGVKKGSVVMLILRRRWEYWVCATALHKLGAILIPGTLQLTKKDIVYRGNAAQVCAIVCVNDPFVIQQVEAAQPDIPSLKNKILVVEKAGRLAGPQRGAGKVPRHLPPPHRGPGHPLGRHHAGVLHLRHHRHAQNGPAQLLLPPGPYRHRQILAAGGGE